MHSERRRGKGRSRILYWFRTPPGVRVGRAALDEDAIRLIEEHNPEVEFDWTRILKAGVEVAPPEPERQRSRRPGRADRPQAASRPAPEEPVAITPPASSAPETPAELAPVSEEFDPLLSAADPALLDEIEPFEMPPSPLEAPPAALARLGSEALSRLRARHAELLARITERVTDPARREELKGQAERLNPDTWVTDAEVTTGLEQYESVFDALRAVVGRKRRRRKRRGGGGGSTPPAPGGSDEGPDREPEGDGSGDQDGEGPV